MNSQREQSGYSAPARGSSVPGASSGYRYEIESRERTSGYTDGLRVLTQAAYNDPFACSMANQEQAAGGPSNRRHDSHSMPGLTAHIGHHRFENAQHDIQKMSTVITAVLGKLGAGCSICWARGQPWNDYELDHCSGDVATAKDANWKAWKALDSSWRRGGAGFACGPSTRRVFMSISRRECAVHSSYIIKAQAVYTFFTAADRSALNLKVEDCIDIPRALCTADGFDALCHWTVQPAIFCETKKFYDLLTRIFLWVGGWSLGPPVLFLGSEQARLLSGCCGVAGADAGECVE
ncbi:hypothetical protein B0H13DRAFT_1922510 [Mycena leptocephala]|nr:hypothetical protein B0H13DRAFT_1922510 [Mycena leptocephala]